MRASLRNALLGAVIGGGIAVLSITAASAADTDGEDSLLGGTQALLGLELPLELTGNAITLIGDSSSEHTPPVPEPVPADPAPEAPTTSGTDGVGSGTKAVLSVDLPIRVEGNSITLIGDSSSANAQPTAGDEAPSGAAAPAAEAGTDGADGVLAGTQLVTPLSTPILVGGNAITLIGDSSSTAPGSPAGGTPAAPVSDATTEGVDGVLAGTQVVAPLTAPLTVRGNAITVIGDAATPGDAPVAPGTPTDPADPGTPGTPTDPADPGTPGTPTGPGDGPAVLRGSVALAATGTEPVSPWFALGAALLGLGLIGARRVVTTLRR